MYEKHCTPVRNQFKFREKNVQAFASKQNNKSALRVLQFIMFIFLLYLLCNTAPQTFALLANINLHCFFSKFSRLMGEHHAHASSYNVYLMT